VFSETQARLAPNEHWGNEKQADQEQLTKKRSLNALIDEDDEVEMEQADAINAAEFGLREEQYQEEVTRHKERQKEKEYRRNFESPYYPAFTPHQDFLRMDFYGEALEDEEEKK